MVILSGDFYGIMHSIDGFLLVATTGTTGTTRARTAGRDSELGGCCLRVSLKHRLASLLRCTRGDTGHHDGRCAWPAGFKWGLLTMGVPQARWMVYKGKSHEHGSQRFLIGLV